MTRKITAALIALFMLIGCTAMAEGLTLTPVITGMEDIYYIEDTGCVVARDANYMKGLYTTSGQAITGHVYTFLEELEYGYLASCTAFEGVNVTGIIDCTGRQVAAEQYISVNTLSARWAIGAYGIQATEVDYVFEVSDGNGGYNYYGVESIDVIDLTTGTVVGNLPYDKCYGGEAYYDHLMLQDKDGNITLYDSSLTPIDYELTSVYTSLFGSENGNIIFKPTGAVVLTGYEHASLCEFNGQDVLEVVKYDEDYNSYRSVVDMAGNVIIPAGTQGYLSYDRSESVVVSYEDDLYGLYDAASGMQLVPNAYDSIERSYNSDNAYLNNGYVCVEKDDMLGFVDASGNITCEIKYPTDNAEVCGSVIVYDNDDGTTTIVAADGVETTVPYSITSYRAAGNGLLLPVENADYMFGIVDWHGNLLVPCTYNGSVTITADSKAVIAHVDGEVQLLVIE